MSQPKVGDRVWVRPFTGVDHVVLQVLEDGVTVYQPHRPEANDASPEMRNVYFVPSRYLMPRPQQVDVSRRLLVLAEYLEDNAFDGDLASLREASDMLKKA